jgi:hypothetical protein
LDLDDEDEVEFESRGGNHPRPRTHILRVPPDKWRGNANAPVLLFDRAGRVCGQLPTALPTKCDAVAFDGSGQEVWLANDEALSSCGFSGEQRARLSLPLLPGEQVCSLSLSKSFVLIQVRELNESELRRGRRALMVSRKDGQVLWEQSAVDRAAMVESRVLAHLQDGGIEHVDETGPVEFAVAPEPG